MLQFLFLQDEREATKARVDRDQERIAKALEAAKGVGDKEKEIKDLALQVNALKVQNITFRTNQMRSWHSTRCRINSLFAIA